MSEAATKRVRRFSVFFTAALFSTSALGGSVAKTTHFVCDVGPVKKTYGHSDWLIHSCGDGRTLLFQSAPGNPPANFSISIEKDGIERGGASTENKNLNDAAFNELKALPAQDLAALMAQTIAVAMH